jgi:uncharacterized protein
MVSNAEKKLIRRELTAFIAFFYIIPIAMLYFGLLPFWSRHLVLVLMTFILTAYAIGKPIKLRELGFRADNLKGSFLWNAVITALALGLIYLGWRFGILESRYYSGGIGFYLFYVFLSAPLQEFVFRSLMFYELNLLQRKGELAKVFISAFVYSVAHIVYRDAVVLLITFLIGLVWGYIYLKKPNFWGVAISHAILGAVTVFFGVI